MFSFSSFSSSALTCLALQDPSWPGHTPFDAAAERIDSSLYSATSSLFSLRRLRRMTVAVLPTDEVLVFSPICLSEAEMAKLFPPTKKVGFIVAPNGWHRLDTALYRDRFPGALVLAPEKSVAAVSERCPVNDSAESYFANHPQLGISTIPVPFKESQSIQECILNVPLASSDGKKRALLVGDVFQNVDTSVLSSWLSPLMRWYGVAGSDTGALQISRGFRWMLKPDEKEAFLTGLADLCRRDPSIKWVVMCHGEPVKASPKLFEDLLNKIV